MSNSDPHMYGPTFISPAASYVPDGHLDNTQLLGSPATAPSAASASLSQSLSRRSSLRGRTAGVLAAAVLAGALGGGAATVGVQRFLGADSTTTSATQVEVVQASGQAIDWTAVAQTATRAVVSIQVSGSDGSSAQGSGVLIDSAGHIVTNNHVVTTTGNATIMVTLDNYAYRATVVGTDPTTDLAVIKLTDPPADLQVMSFADSNALVVGQEVMAIGNPLGLDDTVTTGIISALNRPVTTEAVTAEPNTSRFQPQSTTSDVVVTAAIQTNAAINPGNSGGALVNSSGQLVGITSSIASLSSSSESSSGNIGLGFAIPANQVKYVADQLIANGTAQHAQIGISATDTTTTGAMGATITQVVSGSPADQAGLQVGDLVIAVDDQPVSSTESLVALVRSGEVGQEMTLTVQRNGSETKVKLTPVAASR